MFLNTIFEKSYKKVDHIDFEAFEELVGVSCIGKELMDFIVLPLEDLQTRTKSCFTPITQE